METGNFLFRAIQNQRQIRYNLSFGELLLFHSTSDCLETTWVSSWGSGLSIWIEIVLWERGVLFLEPFKIKGRSGRMWDFESFYYVLCKTTSNHLETAWVSSWGSGLSIWIEIVLWKQAILFLEPFKIKGMSGRMWDSESFFYVIQHQIVLKLLEYHPEVVDCQSELKLFCGNGVSFFKDIQNHRHKKWNMRFGELLLCNSTSDCLETAWVSSWGSELSIWI